MSKFMAEQLVEDYRNRFGLPLMIVRPSVIGPSYEEPYPGWGDAVTAMNGFVLGVIRGSLSSLPFKPDAILDMIPLDIVANTIIVAAWFDTIKP